MSTVTHASVMDALRRCYDPCCRDREISVVDRGRSNGLPSSKTKSGSI